MAVYKWLVFIVIATYFVTITPAFGDTLGIEVRDSEGGLIASQGQTGSSNPLELGSWFLPIISVNIFTLTLIILNKLKRLPRFVEKAFNYVSRAEVSPKITIIILAILFGIFFAFTYEQLLNEEESPDYVMYIKPVVENWAWVDQIQGFEYFHVIKFLLVSLSHTVFGNMRLLPYIASFSVLVLAYLLAYRIAGKRLAGLVAVAVMIQSRTFLAFAGSATYDNLWFAFYLLSAYMLFSRQPFLSPVAFTLSIFSKQLSAVLLPITLFILYRSNIPKATKSKLLIIYGIFFVAVIVTVTSGTLVAFEPNFESVGSRLNQIPLLLRIDGPFFFMFVLPVVVGLFIKAKRMAYADSLIFSIMLTISLPFAVGILTNGIYETHNAIPIVTFFAIGCGSLLVATNDKVTTINFTKIKSAIFYGSIGVVSLFLLPTIFPLLLPGLD